MRPVMMLRRLGAYVPYWYTEHLQYIALQRHMTALRSCGKAYQPISEYPTEHRSIMGNTAYPQLIINDRIDGHMPIRERAIDSSLVSARKQHQLGGDNVMFLLEHAPVYTVGLRDGRHVQDGRGDARRLRSLGAHFARANRGGLITFHGPGQLVMYPMLDLRSFNIAGPRQYVSLLEESVIECCRRMGVTGAVTCPTNTGVWLGNDKICAIGVHFTKRVFTSHGLALNCSTDLAWFRHIVPCGIGGGKFVTSLSAQLGRHVTVTEAANHLVRVLKENLRCDVINNNTDT